MSNVVVVLTVCCTSDWLRSQCRQIIEEMPLLILVPALTTIYPLFLHTNLLIILTVNMLSKTLNALR